MLLFFTCMGVLATFCWNVGDSLFLLTGLIALRYGIANDGCYQRNEQVTVTHLFIKTVKRNVGQKHCEATKCFLLTFLPPPLTDTTGHTVSPTCSE